MYAYNISLIAAFFIGIHLFTMKYLKVSSESLSPTMFYAIATISFLLWLLSRFCIYSASSTLPITTIHILLNLSVIISTLLSIFVYQTSIHWPLFILGLTLVMGGVYCVEKSVRNS